MHSDSDLKALVCLQLCVCARACVCLCVCLCNSLQASCVCLYARAVCVLCTVYRVLLHSCLELLLEKKLYKNSQLMIVISKLSISLSLARSLALSLSLYVCMYWTHTHTHTREPPESPPTAAAAAGAAATPSTTDAAAAAAQPTAAAASAAAAAAGFLTLMECHKNSMCPHTTTVCVHMLRVFHRRCRCCRYASGCSVRLLNRATCCHWRTTL